MPRGTAFDVTLESLASAPKGQTTATVTFRLCTTASCSTVYPGSTKQVSVKLTVSDAEWSTTQGNAGHTGYVPTSFSTASFSDAWSIATPNPPSEIAARTGTVFFNVVGTDNHVYTRAVSTTTGALLWGFDVGAGSYPGRRAYGPAYANNRVATMGAASSSTATPIQVMNATTGGYVSTPVYDTQHTGGNVLTLIGDELFFASGYYGNVVFSANAATGARLWRTEATGSYGGYVMEGQNVAVDQDHVYFFKGGSLLVLSRAGAVVKVIANPFFTKNGLSYYGQYQSAPILDGNGRIFTFTDNYQAGDALPIAAFSLTSDRPLWRTSYSYTGNAAVRAGRLYAARSSSTIVDMIDVTTGLVAGSIDVGGTGNLNSNIVVTDSHLFVSSASRTFAVDLTNAAYPVVWSKPVGGLLAITPDGYLVISGSNGLHAVRLR